MLLTLSLWQLLLYIPQPNNYALCHNRSNDAITETCSSNGNFKYCQNVSPELRGARVTLELL